MMYDGLVEKVESFLEEKNMQNEEMSVFTIDNMKMTIYLSPEDSVGVVYASMSDSPNELSPLGYSESISIDLFENVYSIGVSNHEEDLFVSTSLNYSSQGVMTSAEVRASLPYTFEECWRDPDSFESLKATYDGNSLNVGELTNAVGEPFNPDKKFAELDLREDNGYLAVEAKLIEDNIAIGVVNYYELNFMPVDAALDHILGLFKDA